MAVCQLWEYERRRYNEKLAKAAATEKVLNKILVCCVGRELITLAYSPVSF